MPVPGPANQQLEASTQGKASNEPSTSIPTVVSLPQKNTHAAHIEGTPKVYNSGGPDGISYKNYFSKIGKCSQPTKYIKIKTKN